MDATSNFDNLLFLSTFIITKAEHELRVHITIFLFLQAKKLISFTDSVQC
jgi:hypothetical protein